MEIKHLEVLEMDNGEIICMGKVVGDVKTHGKILHVRPDVVLSAARCVVKTILTRKDGPCVIGALKDALAKYDAANKIGSGG